MLKGCTGWPGSILDPLATNMSVGRPDDRNILGHGFRHMPVFHVPLDWSHVNITQGHLLLFTFYFSSTAKTGSDSRNFIFESRDCHLSLRLIVLCMVACRIWFSKAFKMQSSFTNIWILVCHSTSRNT